VISTRSRSQRIGDAKRKAQSDARFNIVRHASEDGLSKRDAASRAGLSEAGLDTLLYKKLKTTRWPLGGEQ
jgi:hypothetical protein